MELEIQSKKENPLLDRTEVHFVVHHPNEPSPRRENVRDALSKELSVMKELVIVDNLKSSFGVHDTKGYAKIYSKKEVALKVEREHIIKRNHLLKKKDKKKGDEKAEEPAEEKKEEPAAKKEEPDKPEKAKGEGSSEPEKVSDKKKEKKDGSKEE